jgi:hypothetical protein
MRRVPERCLQLPSDDHNAAEYPEEGSGDWRLVVGSGEADDHFSPPTHCFQVLQYTTKTSVIKQTTCVPEQDYMQHTPVMY